MTIRSKTLFLILITLAALFGAMWITSHRILSSGFARLEQSFAHRSLERLDAAIKDLRQTLKTQTGDWAHWDETYQFAADGNTDYAENHLTMNSVANLQLNLIVVLNAEGQSLMASCYDVENEEPVPFPAELNDHLRLDSPLLDHPADDPDSYVFGLLTLKDSVAVLASRPILNNFKEGPARGTLIFGRLVNDAFRERMENFLRHDVEFRSATAPPGEDETAWHALLNAGGPRLEVENDLLHGYTLLPDLYGHPALMARVTLPRDIHAEGQRSLTMLAAWLLLSGVAFGLVIYLTLQRFVLRRISEIANAADRIRVAPSIASHIEVHGQDEVSSLGRSLNAMLDAIRQSQNALQTEKEQLAVTLAGIADAVITTDGEGRIRLINRVAEELTGWPADEGIGQPLHRVAPMRDEETRTPIEITVRPDESPAAVLLLNRQGKERVIAKRASPLHDIEGVRTGMVLVFRDISDERLRERERMQASKLESVGVLAGGIAHDFNNILTAITANLSLATMMTGSQPELDEILENATDAAHRARGLTSQLLTFSKGGHPVKRCMALPSAIRQSVDFCLHGTRVRCEYDLAAGLWPAEVDEGQLGQVLQNLTINAVESMPNGGVLRVSAQNVRDDDQEPEVCIVVADEGVGIPGEYLERIFDPYFTTKHRGSGLGLASSYAIVRKHGGRLLVESEPGRGSRFMIHLPASTSIPQDPPAPSVVEHGQGRVLIMDDEAPIREVLRMSLEKLGYTVDAATEGAEAVALYRKAMEEGQRYGVALLDMTIPGGMGGQQAARCILEIDPNARLIVSSGYSDSQANAEYMRFGFCACLPKPYTTPELARVIKSGIAAPPPKA